MEWDTLAAWVTMEWDTLAAWVVANKLYSDKNVWLIQIPRLYNIYPWVASLTTSNSQNRNHLAAALYQENAANALRKRSVALEGPRTGLTEAGSTMSTDRFLFECVGRIYMIQGGCQVVPVDYSEVEKLMSMADLTEAMAKPASLVQYWLDHHHSSYAHDLHTAAMYDLRRTARAAAKAARNSSSSSS
eukprot:gene25330-10986_t